MTAVGLALTLTTPMNAQVPETPNETDIPEPAPIELGLAGSDRPDIARFLSVRQAWAPSLAPDGVRLAFRTDITGEPQLWVVDAVGGWPDQLTFDESVTFHEWSPGGDWIAYGVDRGGNEREGFYLIDPEGTRERELLAPSDAFRVFGGFSPSGDRIVYATTERNGIDFDIHVLDVVTGADRRVLEGRMGLYPAAWRPDGRAVVLVEARGEDANDVHLLDLETGKLRTLFSPEVAAAYSDFAWTPDGSAFYLATDQGREFSGLARYDAATGELTWIETPDHDVGSVELSHDGRHLVWVTNEGGYSVLHARDLRAGADLAVPELPRGLYGIEWAADAPVVAIYAEGPRVPGDIWTWDLRTGELHRATRSATAGLDMSEMVVPTHHDFEARDGVTLHGLLYTPKTVAAGASPPVLLAVHGGPTSQARPDFDPVIQYLLTRGVAVFDLNFRGSTGYGKSFARLDNKRKRADAVRDMADAVEWLRSRDDVDASRVAVMGGSYGGFMTLAALTMLPGHFDAGVSFVGVSNWVTALEGASPQLKASDRVEYGGYRRPR